MATAAKTVNKASATKAIAEAKKAQTAVDVTTFDDESGIASITIPQLETVTVHVPIVGLSPLIQHAWAPKSIAAILKGMGPKSDITPKREPKNPKAEFEAAKYLLEDGTPGHPCVAFKAATVNACSLYGKDVTKVSMKTALFFHGEGPQMLVPLEFDECVMREDTPRVGMGSIDLRYRPAYHGWKCVLKIDFMPHVINLNSVLAIINAGGLGGVGEWRPSSPKSNSGVYGRYQIDPEANIAVFNNED